MSIILYNLFGSPPCGFVRSLAKEIGVELTLKNLDYANKEHLSKDFLNVNPFHMVPTIDDEGFIVYESNAIAYYLLRKYAPSSKLYPANIKDRARIDQVLSTASCSIQPHLVTFLRPRFWEKTEPTVEEVTSFEKNVLKGLEYLIGDTKFAVGNEVTLADLSLIGHLIIALENHSIQKAKFPKLTAYYQRLKSALPYFEEIHGPAIEFVKEVWAKLK
ncbi:glutathione S-transferase 1-like [Amblyomma americanum]